jgi:hypothetical protein
MSRLHSDPTVTKTELKIDNKIGCIYGPEKP